MAQMDQGIALFEEQAADEVALRKFKNREAVLLSNLIITGESLSVKLDSQVLSIVDLINQQSDLQSVLASLDPELTNELSHVEEEKSKHQVMLRKFLTGLNQF